MVVDVLYEVYVDIILEIIRNVVKVCGIGIVECIYEYVVIKMKEGKVIIVFCGDVFVGFIYIELWGNK